MGRVNWKQLAAAIVLIGTVAAFILTREQTAKIELVIPSNTTVGQTFEVPLRVSINTPINAAEFYFSFPKELIAVKEVRQAGSFFELWIKDSPSFSNEAGTVSLAGGLPSPGFTGTNGLVGTIVFEAKAAGSGEITLDETKSRLLANDGTGTKIEAQYQPVTVRIK